MTKTNAMRLLDQSKIPYKALEYEWDEEHLDGKHAAQQVGVPQEQVFKTLVAHGDNNRIIVFCIPVNAELNLKKAARATKDKKIEMLHVKDLLGVTGYIRGGCSPIGMKKKYPTFMDETAILFDEITISAGVRGCQLYMKREQLVDYVEAALCDLTD